MHSDAMKGAVTNGFKKALSFFGVGKAAYEGTIDEDYRPIPEGTPANKAVPNQPTTPAPAPRTTPTGSGFLNRSIELTAKIGGKGKHANETWGTGDLQYLAYCANFEKVGQAFMNLCREAYAKRIANGENPPCITEKQVGMFNALAHEAGLDDDARHAVLETKGYKSSKDIEIIEFEPMLALLKKQAEQNKTEGGGPDPGDDEFVGL